MQVSCFAFLLFVSFASCAQTPPPSQRPAAKPVGGPCEGCEAVYESKVAFEDLNEADTLSIFNEEGPKLVVSGTVYKADGKTPAPNVVLYVYHTDQTGQYRTAGQTKGWAKRHGSIRGWMKTNAKGEYRFYTVRPASYSKTGPPAHIHVFVKEPGKGEYYIDDFLFDDDPFLTPNERKRQPARGGNGILKLDERNGIFFGQRNLYLGRNVPGYPAGD